MVSICPYMCIYIHIIYVYNAWICGSHLETIKEVMLQDIWYVEDGRAELQREAGF